MMEQSKVKQASNQGLANSRLKSLRLTVRNDLAGYAFVLPWLIGLLAFRLYPIIASFYYSFTEYSVLQSPRWVGLRNYQEMFTHDPLIWQSAYNTLFYTLISVPLGLLLALLLALLMNQPIRGIGFYRTVYFLPSLVPPVAGTLLWILILDPGNGLMNTGLEALGLPRLGWFKSPDWSKPALILMSLWGVGAAALIFLGGLQEIPKVFYEAAEIDGATPLQRLRWITLPLLSPVIFFNLIIGLINSFQVFTSAFIAGGSAGGGFGGGGTMGGPLGSMLMYMLLLYRNAFRYFQLGYASAMAVFLFLVLIIITLALMKSSEVWVYYEADQRR
jgi:multiple sugar transport system permease protein